MERNLNLTARDGQGIQHWLSQAASLTENSMEKLRGTGRSLLQATADKAQQAQGAAIRAGKEVADSADDYVRAKPWQAVAISAGAGLLLGWLFTRR